MDPWSKAKLMFAGIQVHILFIVTACEENSVNVGYIAFLFPSFEIVHFYPSPKLLLVFA